MFSCMNLISAGGVDGVLPVSSYCLPFLPAAASQMYAANAVAAAAATAHLNGNGNANTAPSHVSNGTSLNGGVPVPNGALNGHHQHEMIITGHHHLNVGPHKIRV